MATCKKGHKYQTVGEVRCFAGCVVMPEDENECQPASHGGVTYSVKCVACGHESAIHVYGRFIEGLDDGDVEVEVAG